MGRSPLVVFLPLGVVEEAQRFKRRAQNEGGKRVTRKIDELHER